MKRTIAVLLALVATTTLLTSCWTLLLDSGDTQPIGTPTSDPSQTNDPSLSTPPETGAPPSDVPELSIQEQVLFDVDGVKITATGKIEKTMFGHDIKLVIENNSDKNISLGIENLVVNNYMISDLFSEQIPAGKKSNCSISLTGLEDSGITKIGLIEVYMRMYNDDTHLAICDLGRAEIKTNLYDLMDGAVGTGTEILNKDGIKVIAQRIGNNIIGGKEVVLYMENNSDHDVILSVEDLSVNDYAFSTWGSFTILSGKKAIDSFNLSKSDLEESDIETIEKIEFKLKAYDPDTWKDYFISDVITCTPE